MRKVLYLVFFLIATIVFTGCATLDEDHLIVGTNAEYEPFEFMNGEGVLTGFDVEIMEEIGLRVGRDIEWIDMNFDALIGSIELGNTEVLIASISPTKEREESVSFSNPYYEGHQSIISLNQKTMDSLNNLINKKVAVMEGSTSDFIVSGESEEYPEIRASEIKRFKRATDALQELKNSSVDAVLIDSVIATRLVGDNEDLETTVIESTAEPAVICVKKGSEELLQSINKALDEMKADGTYNKIYENYFIKEVVFE